MRAREGARGESPIQPPKVIISRVDRQPPVSFEADHPSFSSLVSLEDGRELAREAQRPEIAEASHRDPPPSARKQGRANIPAPD